MNDGSSRKPLAERAYVSLAEALTWIAFGDPMTSDRLREQVEGKGPIGAYGADGTDQRLRKFFVGTTPETSETHGEAHFEDRSAGIEWLRMAWQGLRNAVDKEKVTVRGRYTSSYSASDARAADVVQLTGAILATYSQFDISTGGIRRQTDGTPEVIWSGDPQGFDREFDSFGEDARAADGYHFVEVERNSLVRNVSVVSSFCEANSASPRRKPRPALPDAALNRWWANLPPTVKEQPVDRVLVPLCRAARPDHTISRERIRKLASGRKRGPKPFRGDSTAK